MPTVNFIPLLLTTALILEEAFVEVPFLPESELLEVDVAFDAVPVAVPDAELDEPNEKVATGILEIVLQVPPTYQNIV